MKFRCSLLTLHYILNVSELAGGESSFLPNSSFTSGKAAKW